jgi:hypothetical protein
VKVTPQGVRVDNNKLVLAGALKQWANPTKEEAKKAFLARKAKQIQILEHQLKVVRHAVELVKAGKTHEDNFFTVQETFTS